MIEIRFEIKHATRKQNITSLYSTHVCTAVLVSIHVHTRTSDRSTYGDRSRADEELERGPFQQLENNSRASPAWRRTQELSSRCCSLCSRRPSLRPHSANEPRAGRWGISGQRRKHKTRNSYKCTSSEMLVSGLVSVAYEYIRGRPACQFLSYYTSMVHQWIKEQQRKCTSAVLTRVCSRQSRTKGSMAPTSCSGLRRRSLVTSADAEAEAAEADALRWT